MLFSGSGSWSAQDFALLLCSLQASVGREIQFAAVEDDIFNRLERRPE
jgi:hypothetical protein